ncbi:phosphatidylglycerol lysyltransferase domain-containing protein [Xenophilus azovorans]|uniref:phosphatidylglycerol lysyltransferase domain-containing protein n=1 Tax=Xenophilus azovorans TaxID=151755 RepID=UPI00056ED1E1|nr:phosphatidylglycerol lysyltransferase domain-containing protein [Xenophilus azovorans]
MTGEPLTLALQAPIEAALARLRAGRGERCLSEWCFSNLYLFREVHAYRYLPGPWPAIAGRSYDGARHLMPLFEPAQAPAEVLHALVVAHGHLYPVARDQAEALAAGRFTATESRDDADYLYRAAAFADYAGRPLAAKRNQLRRFLAVHRPQALPYAPALEGAAREVLAGWMAHKGRACGEADEAACIEAFAQAGAFGLEGFVHFDGARPVGVVLGQMLAPGVCAIRFAKGRDGHPGLYPHMFRHFCRAFEPQFGRPLHWLNFEQDMGIAGFRRSKMSYRPAALLSKLRLAPAG